MTMTLPRPVAPVEPAADVEAPVLRLVPVPASAPPYDDELADPPAAGPPLLPLRQLRVSRAHLVPVAARAARNDPHEPEPVRERTPTHALPPVRAAATVLVQGLLEVMGGIRPLRQLQASTSDALYAELEAATRRRRAPADLAAGRVRSLHVQHPAQGVAEICATVARSGRLTAVALRLEGDRGRWCCTQAVGF